jgi:myo-inositol-1(or 4)-monophosphatase
MSYAPGEIDELTRFAERLADLARNETLSYFRAGGAVRDKKGPVFDPVTDADREAERAIRDAIVKTYPRSGVLGEEYGETPGEGPWRWVVDPVDGTRAFISGAATWTTLIALEFEGRPVIGLIDQPYLNERWIAAQGRTAFRRGGGTADCKTSGVEDLAKARLSTTEAAAFARLSQKTLVQRFSMDAYAYGLLALGALDLVVEAGLSRHDYAALGPVVEGAGGVITNWRGAPLGTDARGETLAAATPALHAAAMAVLNA